MNFHSILIYAPAPNEKGELEQQPQELELNLDVVNFVFKPPLQPNITVVLDSVGLMTQTPIPEEKMLRAGLVAIDTPDGVKAYVRPDKIQFISNPDLNTYILIFPGPNRIIAKETKSDLMRKLGATGSTLIT